MTNIIETVVTPVRPNVVPGQQEQVYIPKATIDTQGIASYNSRDFMVKDGQVSLLNDIEKQQKNADPLTIPSFVKLLNSEFVYSDENSLWPKAGVKLNRDFINNNVFNKRALIQINNLDFNEQNGIVGINWPKTPFTKESLVKLNSLHFEYSDISTIKTRLPILGNTGALEDSFNNFGLTKIYNNPNDYLYLDNDLVLNFNQDRIIKQFNDVNDKQYQVQYQNPNPSFIANDPLISGNFIAKNRYYGSLDGVTITWYSAIYDADEQEITSLPYDGSQVFVKIDNDYVVLQNPFIRVMFEVNQNAVGLGNLLNVNYYDGDITNFTSINTEVNKRPLDDTVKTYINTGVTGIFRGQEQQDLDIENTKLNLNNLTTIVNNLTNGFLGFLEAPIGEDFKTYIESKFPHNNPNYNERTYVILKNTSTIWAINESGWYDTEMTQPDFFAYGPVNLPSADGVRSLGSKSNWASDDHIHPLRQDLFRFVTGGVVNSDGTVTGGTARKLVINFDNIGTPFQVPFANAGGDLQIQMPYVRESQHIHDWNNNFSSPGVPLYTWDNNMQLKIWTGSQEDLLRDFGTVTPPEGYLAFIDAPIGIFDTPTATQQDVLDAIANLKADILSGTTVNKTYVLKPLSTDGINFEEVNFNNYLKGTYTTNKFVTDELYKILNFKLNNEDVPFIVGTNVNAIVVGDRLNKTDSNGNQTKSIIGYSQVNEGVQFVPSLGDSYGRYVTINDLEAPGRLSKLGTYQTHSSNLPLIKALIDGTSLDEEDNLQYNPNYAVEGLRIADNIISTVTLDTIERSNKNANDILKLHHSNLEELNIDVDLLKLNTDKLLLTLPTAPLSGQNNAYVLTVSNGPTYQWAAKAFVNKSDTINYTNSTSSNSFTGTVGNINLALQDASMVRYHKGDNYATQANSMKFWIGTQEEYNALSPSVKTLGAMFYIY